MVTLIPRGLSEKFSLNILSVILKPGLVFINAVFRFSGKKGKKNKGITLALTDFLQETPGAIPTLPIRKSTLNWADEVEDSYGKRFSGGLF